MTIEKLDMQTPDMTDVNVARIAELFPNVVTEGKDETGKVVRLVDFDALKQELSGNIVEGPQERYRLDWPGKREAMLAANTPITKTLRPVREDSVNFDTTKNLFIEGDNLDALKLLQETYLGKVKMIYIDPPYNTGNDFIYKDTFAAEKEAFLLDSGLISEEGDRLVANTESNGRFHSDWLSMIAPRLKLAKNLLKENGVIFISIGDDEVASLTKLCDQIFGLDNFLGTACRVSKKANNQGDYWSPNFDYVLTYAKAKASCPIFFGGVNIKAYNKVETTGPREGEKFQPVRLYMTSLDPMRGCVNQRYYIEAPDGTLLIPPGTVFPDDKKDGAMTPPQSGEDKVWRWSRDSYLAQKERIIVKRVKSSNLVDSNGNSVKWNVFTKTYLNDVIANSTAKPNSLVEDHINQNSSHELGKLEVPFSFAKPTSLVRHLCEISKTSGEDIVMDFFAGSGTTADAVQQHNAENNFNCSTISVQLPEKLSSDNKDQKAGFQFCKELALPTKITEISKERIRRAGKKNLEEYPEKVEQLDVGFRVLKLDSSNMSDVYYTPSKLDQINLLDSVEHIKKDRTEEDLLFQVMLDWAVDLSLPIVLENIDGKSVYWVGENDLAACFDMKVSEELVKAMAARKPLRAVFRDDGFSDDDMKINAGQLFKQMTDGHTDMKVI